MSGSLRETLSRWSRLKTEAAAGAAEAETSESAAMPEDGAAAAEQQAAAATEPAADLPPEAAPELPDLATLTADSDYTVFLAAGVAEETRREALRILWRSDPVLANLSGLNDYDGDYRAIGTVLEVVETVYKAGAGYLEQLAAAADAETDDAALPPAQGEDEAEDKGSTDAS
ncbi:MAG: DUF3306 domain-containing protein [Defluviicoccus sp.]|nr:DUF3306 domain-containing protein [Defluviicoccus sp.]MDG4607745.1 DUF3306 domain-containing protein [Defluviicoccus sp.]